MFVEYTNFKLNGQPYNSVSLLRALYLGRNQNHQKGNEQVGQGTQENHCVIFR